MRACLGFDPPWFEESGLLFQCFGSHRFRDRTSGFGCPGPNPACKQSVCVGSRNKHSGPFLEARPSVRDAAFAFDLSILKKFRIVHSCIACSYYWEAPYVSRID